MSLKILFQLVLLQLWIGYFLCICVWVGVFISPYYLSDSQMFPYFFPPICDFYNPEMLVNLDSERWTYTEFSQSWHFIDMWLLFLRDTFLQALLSLVVAFLSSVCFSPDICLFLLLSYTKEIVAGAITHLRKFNLLFSVDSDFPMLCGSQTMSYHYYLCPKCCWTGFWDPAMFLSS